MFNTSICSDSYQYFNKTMTANSFSKLFSDCLKYLYPQNESAEHEKYASISMKAQSTNQHFSEPVHVPGVPEVFERMYVLDIIRGNFFYDLCYLN